MLDAFHNTLQRPLYFKMFNAHVYSVSPQKELAVELIGYLKVDDVDTCLF